MISQYIEIIPTVALDFYRRIVKEIHCESDEVKSQSIGFAFKLFKSLNKLFNSQTIVSAMVIINYHLEKLFYDKNYYIREKSRIVKVLLLQLNCEKDNNMIKLIEEIEKTNNTSSKIKSNDIIFAESENSDNHTMSFNYFVK